MQKDKIYIIWIWGIWISALARYYLQHSYAVYWSDMNNSDITNELINEWVNMVIWESPERLNKDFKFIVYTEAVPEAQKEIKKAKQLWLEILTYPQALAKIANSKKLITIAWTHGKSTTTSLVSLVLLNSQCDFTSIVWTLLREFWNKNFFYRRNTQDEEYFILEACEYKRSYLNYKPTVWIITNIELDHLDYYKDLKDYINSFSEYINNIIPWWYLIINWDDKNCRKLIWLRKDISYIEVFKKYFIHNGQQYPFPIIDMKVPWEHILFDAKIAYITGHMIWINDEKNINSLEWYTGVWRRMELIWKTVHNNLLYSDYGHHPTEVSLTLKAMKESNVDKKILTIFQPHQYSRTYELLEGFKNCFKNTDKLIISDIYKSRDTEEDMKKINSEMLVKNIKHENVINWKWLKNTLKLIEEFDKKNTNSIMILMWAWNIDNLRNKIKTVY